MVVKEIEMKTNMFMRRLALLGLVFAAAAGGGTGCGAVGSSPPEGGSPPPEEDGGPNVVVVPTSGPGRLVSPDSLGSGDTQRLTFVRGGEPMHAGDLVVITQGRGYLGKVTSIAQREGDIIEVTVERVSLAEVVRACPVCS